MPITWEDLVGHPEPPSDAKPQYMATRDRPPPLQCTCGRFAKYVGDQHYYNGTWDCYRYTVRCSRCGDVDIECV